jgi:hypothetical protein
VTGIKMFLAALVSMWLALSAVGQGTNPRVSGSPRSSPQPNQVPGKLSPEQKFVMDTVRMAVALPQPDSQDRLRVLSTAADVASTIDRNMARSLWGEGVQIESDLIRLGEKPAVSMMASGQADCAVSQNFVDNLQPDAVAKAEQSLIGAVTVCSKQTLDSVSRKLDAAMEKKVIAPRALMATMEAHGTKSPWSQAHFEKIFDSLPDPKANAGEAENFAAMYARMAGDVGQDAARKAGVQLLAWLSRVDDSLRRTRAIPITTSAMRQVLGEEGYVQALQADVAANAAAHNPGRQQRTERAPGQGVSVLEAMGNKDTDQSDRLRDLPPSDRARQAAANGFAAGTGGDMNQANKYFDMAFAAVDEAWEKRTPESNTAAVVQEVGEAAAHVDALNALARAQKLHDSASQAIAMLAVARVVGSSGLTR